MLLLGGHIYPQETFRTYQYFLILSVFLYRRSLSWVLIGSPHIGYIPTGKVITGSVSGDTIPDDLLIPKEMRIGVPFDIGKFVEWHKKNIL